eukprot:TRINITY_DN2804_c0_g3_i1.p5 TRINITY_DN2804_c0_g3~~TRINITY_DN2804_c0_g3_i1.p5  ORF type:complete len:167 (+),score=4.60 TRINITY_DN2804_c0_g3_i1:51-551(+)
MRQKYGKLPYFQKKLLLINNLLIVLEAFRSIENLNLQGAHNAHATLNIRIIGQLWLKANLATNDTIQQPFKITTSQISYKQQADNKQLWFKNQQRQLEMSNVNYQCKGQLDELISKKIQNEHLYHFVQIVIFTIQVRLLLEYNDKALFSEQSLPSNFLQNVVFMKQ